MAQESKLTDTKSCATRAWGTRGARQELQLGAKPARMALPPCLLDYPAIEPKPRAG